MRSLSIVVHGEPGTGKAQPLHAPVLTPTGWTTIGDLTPGDSVIGSDGTSTRVLAVHERGDLPIYDVTFSDGAVVQVCADHLWQVQTNNDRHRRTHRVLDTDTVRLMLLNGRRLYIPIVEPVQFDSAPLPLDPYVLGVLLGDGGLTKNVTFTSADPEIVEAVRSRLLDVNVVREQSNVLTYHITTQRGQRNPVLDALRTLGLMGHTSLDKFIPELYLTASVEQRLKKQQRLAKGDKSLLPEIAALEKALAALGDGTPVWRSDLSEDERAHLAPVFLLTNKPVLVVVDVPLDRIDETATIADGLGDGALGCCTEIEGDPDVVAAEGDERASLLADLGVTESVVPRLARAAYLMLGRRTFFTTGDKESRAWTFRAGAKAPECAGVIHSDLQRGFIRAEVIHWDELLEIGGWSKAKDVGKLRVEGKEYEVADGDVLEIRFNV